MSDLNQVALSGRLTRDPELRHTANGTAVANTGVAVERYRKEEENAVSFFNLTVFGGFGELVAKKARKGDSVALTGRLEQRSWEAEDGTKRSAVDVIVEQMVGEFIYRKADDAAGAEQTAVATDDDIPF